MIKRNHKKLIKARKVHYVFIKIKYFYNRIVNIFLTL